MIRKLLRTLGWVAASILTATSLFLFYATRPGISAKRLPTAGIVHFKENSPPLPEETHELTVLTYNLGYGAGKKNNRPEVLSREEVERNLAAMARELRSQNADLIFLQELDFDSQRSFGIDQFRYLADKVALPYAAYVLTWNKKYVAWPYWPPQTHFGRVVSGQAVFSRFPILSQQLIYFEKPAENPFWYNWFYLDHIVQHLWLKIGDREASVYNLHLEAFSTATRREQLEKIGKLIKADPAAIRIAAGDYNLASHIEAGRKDNERDTEDLLPKFAAVTGLSNAEGKRIFYSMPSWNAYKKIDHIFFSPGLKLLDSGNLAGIEASDHLAVWAKFKRPLP
ncbi:MAG TPA: hypothetical protein DF383_12795 [Deltaproteobacteria bacterium]|nr:hypothetical protein [Deltaproteobacteria bacterium]